MQRPRLDIPSSSAASTGFDLETASRTDKQNHMHIFTKGGEKDREKEREREELVDEYARRHVALFANDISFEGDDGIRGKNISRAYISARHADPPY